MSPLPRDVRDLARTFRANGHELFVVGGAVRDAVMKRPVADYDFATSATPEEVQHTFRRVLPTGIKHGTVTVRFRGQSYEVTTYRVEGKYEDHRHPSDVAFTRSLEEDLARRDFTMNAMAQDPETGGIVDPFGGREDIRHGLIRTVGAARDRLSEDALRILRAVRFAARFEFSLDPALSEAMRDLAPTLRHVSAERIAQELDRMMASARPSVGWNLADGHGLLGHLIPELDEERSVPDCPPIKPHLFASCDCAPRDDIDLRWAALLHDVGKPRRLDHDERGLTFFGHDEESARMSREILSRLRFANHRIDRICHLIRHHMFGYRSDWSDAAVRRFLARVGPDHLPDLVRLRAADSCGKAGRPVADPTLHELLARAETVARARAPLSRADLAVNGRDIMDRLALPPGPTVGTILEELFETVLADPSLNERERLLEIARSFADERLKLDDHG